MRRKRQKNFHEAHQLKKEGHGTKEIAKRLQIRKTPIIDWLRRESYEERRGWKQGRRIYTRDEEERVWRLACSGKSQNTPVREQAVHGSSVDEVRGSFVEMNFIIGINDSLPFFKIGYKYTGMCAISTSLPQDFYAKNQDNYRRKAQARAAERSGCGILQTARTVYEDKGGGCR